MDVMMQWLHLLGAAIAVGGACYGAAIVRPAAEALSADARAKLIAGVVERARPLAFGVIGVMLLSGFYNLMTKMAGKPPAYHAVLTVKLLLALHIFTVLFLLATPVGVNPARDAKRPRLLRGAAISGVVLLLLSAVLTRGL